MADHHEAAPGTVHDAGALPAFSVVIPVYNEEEGLPALMAMLSGALDGLPQPFELICDDDGSADQSLAVLKR